MHRKFIFLSIALTLAAPLSQAATVFSGTGANTAAVQGVVDDFRVALGTLNAPAPVNAPDGRREINWDAAPDAISQPNAFPGDFFNADVSPRARGLEVQASGATTGFSLSANAGSGTTPAFGSPGFFPRFSEERLFTPVGGTTLDVLFFDPANPSQQALSTGFGAIFSDVDSIGVTSMQFFDLNDDPLDIAGATDGLVFVDALDRGLSFLGVDFDAPVLARVAITSGSSAFDGADFFGSGDAVVMDDFIFGEPVAIAPIPLPGSLALMGVAVLGLSGMARRRRS